MNYLPASHKQLYYEQVWTLVRQVPVGRVATYGQIAKLIPKPEFVSVEDYQRASAQWVGLAMAACPNDVPWQRVINSQGKISPRAEAKKQKQLLQSEGILFSYERLDLHEYQWQGPVQPDEPAQPHNPAQGRLF